MRAAASLPVLLVLAACGRLGFEAYSDGGGPADAELDAPAPGCVVPAITAVATTATTSGASVFAGSCGGAAAPELVLPFDVPAGAETIVSADDPGQDTVVYLASTCPPTAEIAGRHYAFVDGEQASAGFALTGRVEVLLPAGAACTGVPPYWRCGPELSCTGGICMQATCGAPSGILSGSTSVNGSTSGGQNVHASSCGPAGNGGKLAPERYYRLDLATAVSNVFFDTDFPATDYDTLIYVRGTCFDSDIVCEDDNANGLKSNGNTGPLAAGSYYIFVDGFSYRSGAYRLDITVTP